MPRLTGRRAAVAPPSHRSAAAYGDGADAVAEKTRPWQNGVLLNGGCSAPTQTGRRP